MSELGLWPDPQFLCARCGMPRWFGVHQPNARPISAGLHIVEPAHIFEPKKYEKKIRRLSPVVQVALRDGTFCAYCGRQTIPMRGVRRHPARRTLDHIVPQARGGTSEIINLAIACQGCNDAKADLSPEGRWIPHRRIIQV